MRTGKVRTEGPLDKREKQSLDRLIGRRDEAAAHVSIFADRFRQAATSHQRRQWREKWHFEQRVFDILNDGVPTRYKAKLEDRSLADGASKAGEALKEFQRMLRK